MPLAPPTICQAMREAEIFWPAERDLLNRITADADLRRQAGHLWHTDLLELILSLFAQHATAGVLLDDCPDLERHDVLACLGSAPAAIEWLIWSVKIARSREEILASLATQPVLSRFEEPQAGAPPDAKWLSQNRSCSDVRKTIKRTRASPSRVNVLPPYELYNRLESGHILVGYLLQPMSVVGDKPETGATYGTYFN